MAIKKLGIKVLKNRDQYTIFGFGIGYPTNKKKLLIINCGNSGTTLRLLTPLIAGSKVNAKIDWRSKSFKKTLQIRIFKRVFDEY